MAMENLLSRNNARLDGKAIEVVAKRSQASSFGTYGHCSLMFAARITFAHLSVSATTSSSKSAGDIGVGTKSPAAKFHVHLR
jgi:hypothetical protein